LIAVLDNAPDTASNPRGTQALARLLAVLDAAPLGGLSAAAQG